MKSIIYSKAGESSIFRKLQEKGSLIGEFRPRDMAILQTQQQKLKKQAITTSGEDVDLMVEQESLATDPTEYYKTKCHILKEHVRALQKHVKELEDDSEMVRNLNHDYVTQLNKISEFRQVDLQNQIKIDKYFFDCPDINTQTKQVVQTMNKNYKKIVREQKEFCSVFRVMQGEIELYKTKMEQANQIQEGLRKTGENSIDSLVYRLQELTDQNEDLQQINKELVYDLEMKNEKIFHYVTKLKESELYIQNQQKKHDEIILKHNKLQNQFEQKKNEDRRQIHMLKSENEFREEELRTMQAGIQNISKDKNEISIRKNELESENQTMKNTVRNGMRGSYLSEKENRATQRNYSPNIVFK